MQSDPRLIAALDFPSEEAAKQAVEEIGDAVDYYKVGMELYYAAGNEMIRFLKERGKKVFLDLKLQDIPNTVASALKVETRLGVDMINVHAVGGRKMMEAAAAAIKEKAEELGIERPKLLAVTILTSMDDEQFTWEDEDIDLSSFKISYMDFLRIMGPYDTMGSLGHIIDDEGCREVRRLTGQALRDLCSALYPRSH